MKGMRGFLMCGEKDKIARERIRRILDSAPICKVCGAELPRYSYYSDEYE